MTPEFASATDPIFLHVLELRERILRGTAVSPMEAQDAICERLRSAGKCLENRPEDWELAKFAIVAWIDEMLTNTEWRGRGWWEENRLEDREFGSREARLGFYLKAKEAAELMNRDALEIFHVCCVLGFTGFYDDRENASRDAEKHDLPGDRAAWARRTAAFVRLGLGRPPIDFKSQTIEEARPREGRRMLIRRLVAGGILAMAIGIVVFRIVTGGPESSRHPDDASRVVPTRSFAEFA